MSNQKKINSSFRDPSGFLFTKDDKLFRQINKIYAKDYELLISSGLYKKLSEQKLLIPHKELAASESHSEQSYKIIEPQKINIISYPYEWSFSQLKDAALLTIKIQKIALEHGMSLKDASAYNVQFLDGQAIFIDTYLLKHIKRAGPGQPINNFANIFWPP